MWPDSVGANKEHSIRRFSIALALSTLLLVSLASAQQTAAAAVAKVPRFEPSPCPASPVKALANARCGYSWFRKIAAGRTAAQSGSSLRSFPPARRGRSPPQSFTWRAARVGSPSMRPTLPSPPASTVTGISSSWTSEEPCTLSRR